MPPTTYTQVVLQERPKALIDDNTFRTEKVPFDLKPGPKQVLVQVLYLSLDPTQRGWINDQRGYMEPVAIGAVMRSSGIGVVIQAGEGSRHKVGGFVTGLVGTYAQVQTLSVTQFLSGWREYGVFDDADMGKIECVLLVSTQGTAAEDTLEFPKVLN